MLCRFKEKDERRDRKRVLEALFIDIWGLTYIASDEYWNETDNNKQTYNRLQQVKRDLTILKQNYNR